MTSKRPDEPLSLLTDECTRSDVSDYLEQRGHEVQRIATADSFLRGRPDNEIAGLAESNGLIVVTGNYKHFYDLALKRRKGGKPACPRLSLLLLKCRPHEHLHRLGEEIEAIEFEFLRGLQDGGASGHHAR